MPKITLSSPIAWPHPHGIMRHFGDVLDVTDEERDLLVSLGAVADGRPAGAVPVVASDADKGNAQGEPEDSAEDSAPAAVKRPAKSASLEAWQEYARTQGDDPKGATRQELIARYS